MPGRDPVVSTSPFVLLAVGAGVALLYLGRSLTFWQDEWWLITFEGEVIDLLRPLNEHWYTLPSLLYRATFGIVGLHSYLPYLAELIALHLLAVAAAFVLVRRRLGASLATLTMLPLLLLGSGAENLFWAFQTGFIGSVACGLWAIVVLERPGRWAVAIGSVLLLASLMCSGMGLMFLVAAAGRLLFDPALRRNGLALIPPSVGYLAWFATVGNVPVGEAGHLAAIPSAAIFALRGIGHAIGAFTGLGWLPGGLWIGVVAFGTTLVATGWVVIRWGGAVALGWGSLLAIGAMYGVIGLVRADLESDFATRSRYVYVAAFFMVLAAVDWWSWLRARWRPAGWQPSVAVVVVVVTLVAVTLVNVLALGTFRARARHNADRTRAYVELALARGHEPWADPSSVLPGMPPLAVLRRTIEEAGSPLEDALVPAVAPTPTAAAREWALLRMVGTGFRVGPASGSSRPIDLVVQPHDVEATPDGRCVIARDGGPRPALAMSVPGGSRIRLSSTHDLDGFATLGHGRPPSRRIPLELAGSPVEVVVPDTNDGTTWHLRLDLPDATAPIEVCGFRGP